MNWVLVILADPSHETIFWFNERNTHADGEWLAGLTRANRRVGETAFRRATPVILLSTTRSQLMHGCRLFFRRRSTLPSYWMACDSRGPAGQDFLALRALQNSSLPSGACQVFAHSNDV
jgi:hypothetical protein